MIAKRVRTFPGMRAAPPSHRLALSPVCWGISDIPDWGHQLDPERVLSEAAAVGEGVITAGPPGFLPDRSDQAKPLLKRNRLRLIAGDVHAILHFFLAQVAMSSCIALRIRSRSLPTG